MEIASEYRYRKPVVPPGTLFVTISQSGETADTLAALRMARSLGYLASLAICNVPESSLVRESELVLMTRAGPEIGVASTKAFTTQLAALQLLALALARRNGLGREDETKLTQLLEHCPAQLERVLALDATIRVLAERFAEKHHALFLGRGSQYPIALEGALKLKEISYIHAEAYPAGELKHGPLALVDDDMPVIAVAPDNALLEKLKSNLQEVRARGGQLIVFADPDARIESDEQTTVIELPEGVDGLAGADRVHGAAAAARLSRGGAQGHGRGPAAQPREVRHGRISAPRPAAAAQLREDARRRPRPRAASTPPRLAQIGIQAIDVRLYLFAAALIHDLPPHRRSRIGLAVAGRREVALDAVYAAPEHHLDALRALAKHDDLHRLSAVGRAHDDLLRVHRG